MELKIQKVEFHPIQLCCLIKNVLKKYGHTFDIKKGYVNIDGFWQTHLLYILLVGR